MKKKIRLTESDLARLVKRIIKEQEGGELSLGLISKIFKDKGFEISKDSDYKIKGHKETRGPVQNPKTGEYYWNYEFYVPLRPHTEEGIEGDQLWVDKRREGLRGGTESENIIISLTGPEHQVSTKKNGRRVDFKTLSTQDVLSMLNGYTADFK